MVTSADDSARSQVAASLNQHCADPVEVVSDRKVRVPASLPGSGFATAVPTFTPSSQASTPVPAV